MVESDRGFAGSADGEHNETSGDIDGAHSGVKDPDNDTFAEEIDTADELFSTGLLVANVALTQGLIAIVVVAGAWYLGIPSDALGVGPASGTVGPGVVLTGVGLGLVLWLASESATAVSDAVGVGTDDRLREMLAPETIGGWVALLAIGLPLVAVSEELLFRGAAIGAPATGLDASPWALAIVSSVAFGFCHGIQGRAGVAVTGLLGLALAGAFVLTGSLVVVIVAHYVLNATEFLVHEGFGADPLAG